MLKTTIVGSVALAVAGCASAGYDGTLRAAYQQSRLEYRLACIDELVDGRNQPLSWANEVCTQRARMAYPPYRGPDW